MESVNKPIPKIMVSHNLRVFYVEGNHIVQPKWFEELLIDFPFV